MQSPSNEADRFDLQRFVAAQAPVLAQVLAELRAGRKASHWMWFVFPQLAGLAFPYAWGGPIASTTRLTPFFGTRAGGRVHYGLGYTGHGLGSTRVAGLKPVSASPHGEVETSSAPRGSGGDGLRAQDLLDAVQEEYREGEMLPPDDAAEEWLKLLDHHPEQVVGVSSFRRGRPTEERLVNQII